MELQPLIEEIVNSKDPVLAFSKVAADLDDRWKTTLAREVNKGLFSKNLSNSELNNNVEFNVIDLPQMSKMASEEETQQSYFEKIASEKVVSEKVNQLTPDMFSFDNINTSQNEASTYYQEDSLFKEAIQNDRIKQAEQELEYRQEVEKVASETAAFLLEEEKEIRLKDIASNINSEEELKAFVKVALEKDMDKVAERVIELYKPDLEYFKKVASEILTLDKKAAYEKELNDLIYVEKEALAGLRNSIADKILSVPGHIVGGAGRIASGVLRIPGAAGKVLFKTGKFAYKHPILTAGTGIGIMASSNSSKHAYNTLVGV